MMNGQQDKHPKPPKDEAEAMQGYEVEGLDEVENEDEAPIPPVPVVPKRSRKPSRADRNPGEDEAPRSRAKRAEAETSSVSDPWSRGAEWGSTLIVVAVSFVLTIGLTYLMFSPDSIGWSVLVLVGGLVLTTALAYPIFVTLERPVRITPEQALKDFLGALSHRRPHYKRMWLLLSDRGKTSGPFESFGEFQNYWKEALADLKAKALRKTDLLTFSVADFKSEKSAGETVLDATATIYARTGSEETLIAVFQGKMWFVKGPDRMWYLNQGVLPDETDRPD